MTHAPFSRRRLSLAVALVVLTLATSTTRSQSGVPALADTMSAIAAADDGAGRRRVIVERLTSIGIEPTLQEFSDPKGRTGTNVVAQLPGGGERTLLIGAHYDRVAAGRGVVDNGGACAALIALLSSMKPAPLSGHTLVVVFFDLEEVGLQGSRAYFERLAATARPAYAINLDVFAYGDTFFVTASNPGGPLIRALEDAARGARLAVRDAPVKQYPGSDHMTMIDAGVDTLGVAIVDAADVDGVLGAGPLTSAKLGTGPRVLTLIHSPRDTMDAARPEDVLRAVPVLEQTLRLIDRAR